MMHHSFLSTMHQKKFKTVVNFLLTAGIFSCPFSTFAQPLDAHLIYQQNRYLLGPGDVLSLQVSQEPDYSQERVLVGPDGHAQIMGIGDVDMKNRNVDDVTAEIKTRLQKMIVEPQVTFALIKTKPCLVYLSGAVLHSGAFQILTDSQDVHVNTSNGENLMLTRTETRLSNVLANAGGVMPTADISQVQVKRADDNSGQSITVNLWKVLKEGAQDQDILINSGDTVYVPQADKMAMSDEDYKLLLGSSLGPKVFPVRVVGEVSKPGIYHLDATSPLLNSAIAEAGGYAPQASRKIVAIRRFTNENTFSTIYVDETKLDLMLRPNDVVYIPENKVYKAGRFGQQIALALAPFQTIGSVASSTAQVFGFGGWDRSAFKQNAQRK